MFHQTFRKIQIWFILSVIFLLQMNLTFGLVLIRQRKLYNHPPTAPSIYGIIVLGPVIVKGKTQRETSLDTRADTVI